MFEFYNNTIVKDRYIIINQDIIYDMVIQFGKKNESSIANTLMSSKIYLRPFFFKTNDDRPVHFASQCVLDRKNISIQTYKKLCRENDQFTSMFITFDFLNLSFEDKIYTLVTNIIDWCIHKHQYTAEDIIELMKPVIISYQSKPFFTKTNIIPPKFII